MKTDLRVDRNTRSVTALADLMRDVLSDPCRFCGNTVLVAALGSQGRLSKYSDESCGIRPSSLNTVKRIAEKCIPGGYEAFDRLRLGALEAIEKEEAKLERSNKRTKQGLDRRLKESEHVIQQQRQDMLLLTLLIDTCLKDGRRYALESGKSAVIERCTKEQNVIRNKLSLRRHPIVFEGVNV